MRTSIPFLLIISLVSVLLISGCVTKNAKDLFFTEAELKSLGYDVNKIITPDERGYPGYYRDFEGLLSVYNMDYRIGDFQAEEWKGEIFMFIFIFNSESDAKDFFTKYEESIKQNNEFRNDTEPDFNASCEYNQLGDESYCCTFDYILAEYPINESVSYSCVVRYGENTVTFVYHCLDRTFEDVEELMGVFESKLD